MHRRPPGYRPADSSKTNAERKALHKTAVYNVLQPKGIVQRAHTASSSRRRATAGSSSVKASVGNVPRFDGAMAVTLALQGKGEHRSEREIALLAVFRLVARPRDARCIPPVKPRSMLCSMTSRARALLPASERTERRAE